MQKAVAQRLMDYVRFDTRSDSGSTACPSTPGQLVLAKYLVEELKAIGLTDAALDENGYVTATLLSNVEQDIPVIGFLAHLDTSPEISGAGVKPRLIENYSGGDIVLNQSLDVVLSPEDFPELNNYIEQDIIVTDGTTLLGADNKAGIAEIITAIEYLVTHSEIKHGTVKVGFTPDEEIGRGADRFDTTSFGAAFAYTVDGGPLGELEYETFNAAEAKINIKGRNVHPGTAKNAMIHSLHIAMELNAMLPAAEVPGHTEGYEGFYHLNSLRGSVEETAMTYIVRDHDKAKFAARKERLEKITVYLNDKYGEGTVAISLRDQYYNMREKIEPVYHIVELAKTAIEAIGITANIKPVRGGTDGAKLSYMGLPCPNLFSGGHNFHGKYEYISVQSMEKAVEMIVRIIALHTKAGR
ncbi:peptidase T [Anaerosporomusa subterranea]|uniref:Peptidase T n=1 Tax=Anaerosporomusa subterranea TaxID=1794912 RepID=A0A154BW55_ANASB|nr:peptidase T [Anaerosporomusa subterranea]KYZ78169.1 peptidase T [Anaerosporomusa subterranea]